MEKLYGFDEGQFQEMVIDGKDFFSWLFWFARFSEYEFLYYMRANDEV